MKQKVLTVLLVFLASMLACVLPGLEAPAPSPIDSKTLSTIVVSTANAAASQTALAPSVGTGLPSDSAIPKPTAMNRTEQLPGGTTKYTDYDGGFEVIFPVGWLALRPNSDEFNLSLEQYGAHNPALRDTMTTHLAAYDPDLDRLYSYALRPDIRKNALFGFSKLAWDPKDPTSLDNNTMGKMVQDLESSEVIPGFRADTAQLWENSNAVMIMEIGGRFRLSDAQGGTVPLYSTAVFFKPTPNSVTAITFTFSQDYSLQLSADVKSIIESIRVISS